MEENLAFSAGRAGYGNPGRGVIPDGGALVTWDTIREQPARVAIERPRRRESHFGEVCQVVPCGQ